MASNRVWAEIDLGRLANNLRWVRRRVGPGTKILVVVKADAYGHGAVAVARKVVTEGADMLGVGDSHEALELRIAGIRVPILILGAIIEGEIENVVAHDITPCIHSAERIQALQREAVRQDRRIRVHLMVDSGMGRLGVSLADAAKLITMIQGSSHLELEGIGTHLSSVYGSGEDDRRFTETQLARFCGILVDLNGAVSRNPLLIHAENSGALFQGSRTPFNLVRPGNAVYGVNPDRPMQEHHGIEPVLSLRTQIAFLKDVPAGTPISYNRTYETHRPSRIATVPVGYNDGFRFGLSNRVDVLLHGRRCPVVGKITMDYTMIDVTDVPRATVGDTVTLIGESGDERITVQDLASTLQTIPFEITCGLGRRVRRVYLDAPPPVCTPSRARESAPLPVP